MYSDKRKSSNLKGPSKIHLIAVISPAGPVKRGKIFKNIRIFEEKGYRIEFLPSVFKKTGYLAGSDKERLNDLREALTNPEYDAVICARGGYGSVRLLESLSKIQIKSPRPFFGFSDITALHIFLNNAGWVTFHSPNLNGFDELTETAKRHFFDFISGNYTDPLRYKGKFTLYKGSTTGVLCGGNLSIISSLSGTRVDLRLGGKILLIEEVNEEPYKIDRMLNQLLLRDDIGGLRGIVFGKFKGCGKLKEIISLLKEFSQKLKKPAIYGIDVGHIRNNLLIPLNIEYSLNADKILLTSLDNPIL
ncbi:MAG: S66 peptidase family protein [Myxococcota bacterium]